MTYLEILPENCPPADANSIENERIVFRLVNNNPPLPLDFRSQRAEKPNATFSVNECYARGLSVYSEQKALDDARKLPRWKNSFVCQLKLTEGAGMIQKTFKHPHHFTWWPLASYVILEQCEIIKP